LYFVSYYINKYYSQRNQIKSTTTKLNKIMIFFMKNYKITKFVKIHSRTV
jgi:hypothetical protein